MLSYNPVMCGVLICHYDTLLLRAGVEMSNVSEAVMGLAHLYNACRNTGVLKNAWLDMDAAIDLFEPAKVFLGSPPTDAVTFRNRYILTAGISLRAFAGNKDKCHEHKGGCMPRHWYGSERRRRLLEPDIPLSSKLLQQQSKSRSMNCLCNDIQDVINPKSKVSPKAQRGDLTPLQYVERVTDMIDLETQRSLFYVLIMNQRCTRLLQDLYQALEHPLDEDGFHIEEKGFHASIIYDILYAANFACPECHRAAGK